MAFISLYLQVGVTLCLSRRATNSSATLVSRQTDHVESINMTSSAVGEAYCHRNELLLQDTARSPSQHREIDSQTYILAKEHIVDERTNHPIMPLSAAIKARTILVG
jgi:hypothetical protein